MKNSYFMWEKHSESNKCKTSLAYHVVFKQQENYH